MIDLNDVISGIRPTGVRNARKAFRGHCDRRNARQTNFGFRCDNPTRVNPEVSTKPKHAIVDSVSPDTLLAQPTFSPFPWILIAIVFVLTVGLVAGPSDGKVMTCVGALVWFYILFYSEPEVTRPGRMAGFDASHATERRPSDGTDARTGHISNTVSTAVWSLRPASRHALTYSDLTTFRPPSSWNR